MVAPLAPTIMTKTPKNGSSSSTPTPGGPASVGTGPPPSVGSTKSEPIETNDAASSGAASVGGLDGTGNRSGTPHSLPENSTSCTGSKPSVGDSNLDGTENSTLNGGGAQSASSVSNDGLLCDSNNPDQVAGSGGQTGSGETPNADGTGSSVAENQNSNNDPNNVGGAQIKQEDTKPNASNCSTPGVLPSETDLFDGFDSKDGGKPFPLSQWKVLELESSNFVEK